MSSLLKERIGSAHVIGVVALVLSAGGGYAVAGSEPPPQRTVAYELDSPKARSAPGGRANLHGQLVIPADGLYAVNAKLSIRAARKMKGAQVFACHLDAVGGGDEAHLTLEADEAGSVAMQTVGSPAAPMSGGTQAIDVWCETARKKGYTVKDVRATAVTLDGIEEVSP